MKSLIITFILLTGLQSVQQPGNITGKWVVDDVEVTKVPSDLTSNRKQALYKSLTQSLTNAVFNFKADHRFSLSANLKGIPKADYWEYDAANGVITIKQHESAGIVMKISITGKDGATFFNLIETPIILKVRKK